MTNWQTPGSLTSAANPGGTSSPRRITTERRSAIAALIALAANGVFVAGIVADIIGVVSVAILQEKRNLSPKVAAIPDTGPGIPGERVPGPGTKSPSATATEELPC